MKQRGSVLLIVGLAVVLLLMIGAAFFLSVRGSAGAATRGPALGLAFTAARSGGGLTATVTLSNNGSTPLKNLRLVRADIVSMTGSKPLPLVIGALQPGVSIVVTLPYTGPAPAAMAPVQIQLHYDYREGFFTRGGGSTSITTVVP